MSFDVVVFDANAAPRGKEDFDVWLNAAIEAEQESYDDVSITTENLAAWFHDMRKSFPAMNGPFAPAHNSPIFETSEITGYQIGPKIIYCDFRWSVAEAAYSKAYELAQKHGVAIFDPQSEQVFYPDVSPEKQSFWTKILSLFRN